MVVSDEIQSSDVGKVADAVKEVAKLGQDQSLSKSYPWYLYMVFRKNRK